MEAGAMKMSEQYRHRGEEAELLAPIAMPDTHASCIREIARLWHWSPGEAEWQRHYARRVARQADDAGDRVQQNATGGLLWLDGQTKEAGPQSSPTWSESSRREDADACPAFCKLRLSKLG
jgi:hypothetical protein